MIELTKYKGYQIEVTQDGDFRATDTTSWYDTLKAVKAKIDKIVKSEVKGKFPIPAIFYGMVKGNITSMNAEQNDCWFVKDGGSRSKDRLTQYNGKARFYAVNDHNVAILKRYGELESQATIISKEQRTLETQLTEPIGLNNST